MPATPIGDLPDWWLHTECRQCRHRAEVSLADLAVEYRRLTKLTDVLRRLRCHGYRGQAKCLARPRLVLLVKVAVSDRGIRKLREITVVNGPRD